MSKYAIVVVGYNRTAGILRLLKSLKKAEYGEDNVDLIISLDNCGNDIVERAVEKVTWTHGNKIIRTFPERQGLRKHILACGEYLNEYEAIAVLEDDLIVSPAFYSYMVQSIEYYKGDSEIAGISLYTHGMNVNEELPFTPAVNSSDIYFQQFAQSWGQIWIREPWMEFKKWYLENHEKPITDVTVPEFVSSWSDNSWLKYHIKYCIENKKYFVYPYTSLTTCFSDAGEHSAGTTDFYQVRLMMDTKKKYHFEKLENGIIYDAFFERCDLWKYLDCQEDELCVDLYGTKNNQQGKRYWLTKTQSPYQVVKKYGLCMRPHEYNVIFDIEGTDIFLYDTTKAGNVISKSTWKQNNKIVQYYYNFNADFKKALSYIVWKIHKKFGR